MDVDVLHRQVRELLDFKSRVEDMMKAADGNVDRATLTLDELVAFKAAAEKALPDIRRALVDTEQVASDLATLRTDLAPIIEWVKAKQTEEATARAAAAAAAAKPREENPQPAETAPAAPPPLPPPSPPAPQATEPAS